MIVDNELVCDHERCDQAYPATDEELLHHSKQRLGALKAGWSRRNGKDYCPPHGGGSDLPALIAVITAMTAQRQTYAQIAEGLGWTRSKVQKFCSRHHIGSRGMGRPRKTRAGA